jgi:osmotically-inducible protein OsmY
MTMQLIKHARPAAAVLLLTLVTLAGCSPANDSQTVGETVDAAIEKADDKMDTAKSEAQQGVDQAQQAASEAMSATVQATSEAMTSTVEAASDTAITLSIKGRLAADADLKVLDISVSTVAGRAVLSGSAPDAASRDHAGKIAMAVDGVVSVDNQLVVAAK